MADKSTLLLLAALRRALAAPDGLPLHGKASAGLLLCAGKTVQSALTGIDDREQLGQDRTLGQYDGFALLPFDTLAIVLKLGSLAKEAVAPLLGFALCRAQPGLKFG